MQRSLYVRALALLALFLAALPSPAAAQVQFFGDARFRPRLDLDDRTEDPSVGAETQSVYYMYRLRLNMTAPIGAGYYVRSRIGHNGVGSNVRGGGGKLPDVPGNEENSVSDENARRPELDLMYMYLGRETEHFGFDLGLIPVLGSSNPLWDLHYYPDLLVDVPYFAWSTDGGFGARGHADVGPGRFRMYALLDRAHGRQRTTGDGATLVDNANQYTLTASYAMPVGRLVLQPMVMKSLSAGVEERDADGEVTRAGGWNAPLTVGTGITFPALGALVPSATLGYSWGDQAHTMDPPHGEYTAWLARAKLAGALGPGSLLAWVDFGRRYDRDGVLAEVESDFFFVWLNYAFTVYESERGSFTIGPEWRFTDLGRAGSNLRERHVLEINFDVSFR